MLNGVVLFGNVNKSVVWPNRESEVCEWCGGMLRHAVRPATVWCGTDRWRSSSRHASYRVLSSSKSELKASLNESISPEQLKIGQF